MTTKVSGHVQLVLFERDGGPIIAVTVPLLERGVPDIVKCGSKFYFMQGGRYVEGSFYQAPDPPHVITTQVNVPIQRGHDVRNS